MRNTADVIYTGAARQPAGIAVQEVCNNTLDRVGDSLEKLVYELVSRGYTAYGEWTGKTVDDCKQYNYVFAIGSPVASGVHDLAYDGHENKTIVCLEMNAYLAMTTCSTQLSNELNYDRYAQAYSAYAYATNGFYDYATFAGGDFNDARGGESPDPVGIWYPSYTEADTRNPPHATAFDGKIDYGWGQYPRIISQLGITLSGRGDYSDHELVWAPFNWLGP